MSEELQALQAVPEKMRAVTKFTADHAKEIGLPSPEAVNYMMSVANMLLNSALITPDMSMPDHEIGRLKGAGYTPEQIGDARDRYVRSNAMAKMLVGHEMGMDPMAALQDIDIVKGKIFVRYPQLIDQMLRKGFVVKWVERSNTRAAMEVTRPGVEPELFEFTIEDAKMAGLTRSDKDGMYEKRPRVMLCARVASEAHRMTGGRGNVYTPEEKQEIFGGATSTTDALTEADVQRAAVLDAKYTVKVKAQPIEVAPEPPTTDPAPALAPQPELKPLQYEVYVLLPTAGGGKPKPVLLPDETMTVKATASLRAQALANTTGQPHIVVKFDPNTDERQDVDHCHPPKLAAPAPAPATTPAPKPEEAPVAAPAQEALMASQPATTKDVDPNAPKARLDALAVTLNIPNKTAMARFTAYMAGYVGCPIKEFKATPISARLEALESLEYLCAYDPNEFASGPEESGKRRRKFRDAIKEYLTGLWPNPVDAATVNLALKLSQKWGNSPRQFQTWLTMEGVALDFISPMAEVHALLRVLLKTVEGIRLLKLHRNHNMAIASYPDATPPVLGIVEQLETRVLKCSIEDATPKAVEAVIESFERAVKEEARRKENPVPEPAPEPAKPEPAPEPTAETQEGDGNLFDGGSDW